ncbi:hypothetical protein K504DRAFT_466652 [Pleomassaria siparia CBS 279.74]|uniref:Uncharacterized protein n=1 Tax=Pleomassaria siparia CBS 279.74 TaxID=1314801 RepID=A0A6G1KBN6_9PLEO|nr:hypothetical protein K504DRAFT_466652 [Pleomassaria siparia CBS 279.74]
MYSIHVSPTNQPHARPRPFPPPPHVPPPRADRRSGFPAAVVPERGEGEGIGSGNPYGSEPEARDRPGAPRST